MIQSELEKIDAALLARLCDEKCPESDSLDFKREIGRLDELMKDVCAMANANGGDLVYGIDEKDGCAGTLTPLKGDVSDNAILRIRQSLDGIEPRIHGIRDFIVDLDEGYAIILRIPRSFDGPHCYRQNSARRFVLRNGPGTSDMTFEQLRNAFDRTATLAQRAVSHGDQRLSLISADRAPVKLQAGPLCVVQLIPIAAIAGTTKIDVVELHGGRYTDFAGPDWASIDRRLTLDGLLVHPTPGLINPTYGYSIVYRSGILESVRQYGDLRPARQGQPKMLLIPGITAASYFGKTIKMFSEKLKAWGITGPAILQTALLHVDGFQLLTRGYIDDPATRADRPDLFLPNLWIENLAEWDVEISVREVLDLIWQSFGCERCDAFDT